MELYQLRTFVTVAEEGHLTRAAERLFTSQPAISAHVKGLEEELGVTLFERTPKGMVLTAPGRQLLERAQRTLAAAGELLDEARAMQDELVGEVHIALNTDATFLRVIDLQRHIGAAHPRLATIFMDGSSEANLPALRTGRVDAGFVGGIVDDPLLEAVEVMRESLVVAVPAGMRGCFDETDVADLARQPWIHTSPNCPHYRVMSRIFEAHCCEPRRVVVAEREDALLAMVRAGVGLGIVRQETVAAIEAGDGSVYPLALPLACNPVNLVYARKREHDPLIQAVLAAARAIWPIAEEPARRQAG
jgi:DNA-binding transcriptional LysR family regulator